MAGNTFPGRAGSNPNPFGGNLGSGTELTSSGVINRVVEEDENDTVTSPTTSGFTFSKGSNSAFGGPFGNDGAGEGPPSSFRPGVGTEGFPAQYSMGRRTSVSAESLNPTASSNDNWTVPFHDKTEDQVARLQKAISGNFLFSHLDDEQSAQVLGALVEKKYPAKLKVCNALSGPSFKHILTRIRLYRKVMRETTSTSSRREALMFMSTSVELCSQARKAWAPKSQPSNPADHLENWP